MRVQTPGIRFSLALFPFLGAVLALACGSGSPEASTPEAVGPVGNARAAGEPTSLPSPSEDSTSAAATEESLPSPVPTGGVPAATTPAVSVSPTPTTAPSQMETPATVRTSTPTPTPLAVRIGTGVGDRAPDFRVTTVDGQSVDLASLKGKPFILYFFATW